MWVDIGYMLIAGWLGISLFFTAVITPSAFKGIPSDKVGDFLGLIFPKYYKWGMFLFLVSFAIFLFSREYIQSFLSFIGLLFMIFAEILRIRIRKTRMQLRENPTDTELKRLFIDLHRFSAYCNFTSLTASVLIIVLKWF
ncbi:MAG: DUF4149 domain-containing protein [candidate division WOR-3 bacterium]